MTDGAIKVFLMVMLLGGLVGATYVPERGELPTFLVRAMAVVWSAMAMPDRALQHFVQRRVTSSANRVSARAAVHGQAA